jgi:hypothetical protein
MTSKNVAPMRVRMLYAPWLGRVDHCERRTASCFRRALPLRPRMRPLGIEGLAVSPVTSDIDKDWS